MRKIRIRSYFRGNGTKVRAHSREHSDRPRQTRVFEYYPPDQYSYTDMVAKINEQLRDVMTDPSLSFDERVKRKQALEHIKRAYLSQMQQEGVSEMELYSHKKRKKKGKRR